jgi:rod shape determining protein RodA
MTPLFRKILGMNWVLVLTMYGLLVFGVFAIESAARHIPVSGVNPADWGAHFANLHKKWIIIGSAVYFVTALIDYRWLKWLGIPMYIIGIVLLLYLLQQGSEVHQLSIPGTGFSFQPTQIVIAAGILLIGFCLEGLPKLHRVFEAPVIRFGIVGILCGIPFLLVVKNGDMGSAIVWVPVALVGLLVGGLPFRYISLLAILVVAIVPVMYYLILPIASPRGAQRVDQYLEFLREGQVELNDDNYAPYFVSMAVGKAGWEGAGWNAERHSLHSKKYIPWMTAHNDYIFAVIAEEHGFRGSLLLISAFTLLIIQCLFIAFYSRDYSGQIIAAGVVALFFAHTFESIGMCVLLMPITGIPLPLVSYSGTFVIICMFLLGLVQSIWVHRREGVEEPVLTARERGVRT